MKVDDEEIARVQVYKELAIEQRRIYIPGRQMKRDYCRFFCNFPNNKEMAVQR